MFENPRRSRQVRNFTTNVPKILDLKSSSEQIFFRKLSLGAPDVCLTKRRPERFCWSVRKRFIFPKGYPKVIPLTSVTVRWLDWKTYRKQLTETCNRKHVTELCQFDKERETMTKYTGFLVWQLQISWWRLKSSYEKLHAYKPPQQIFLHYRITFILNVSKL